MFDEYKWTEASKVFARAAEIWGTERVFIAGGAIRDTLNSKPIKDFDFFIQTPNIPDVNIIHVGETRFVEAAGAESLVGNPDFKVYTSVGGYASTAGQYQLIFSTNDIYTVVAKFDINICKCWYGHNSGICTTPEYEQGIRDKKIVANLNCTNDRINRMKDKYRDFKVLVGGWYK